MGLVWFSPDCTFFSKARGGKPVNKKIRGLVWVEIKWALAVRPRVMFTENVEEIQNWGPLLKDAKGNEYPDPARKGETFQAFIKMLTTGIEPDHPGFLEACEFLKIKPGSENAMWLAAGLGYQVEYRELRACDYGAPTIRNRFFLIARCDGRPIVWPAATHGDPISDEVKSGKLKPWRTVSEVLDWTLPCPSIFDSRAAIKKRYGLKANRPLADNTLKRVARGVDKFVINSAHPFIISVNHTSAKTDYDCFRGQGVAKPMQTITAHHGNGLITPCLAVNNMHNTGGAADEPLKTITTGGHHMLVTPVMTAIGQTGFSADRSYAPTEPMRTVVSKNEQCVVAPSLIQYHAEQVKNEARGQPVDKPLATVDASPRYGLEAPLLAKYYGQGTGQRVDSPAHTVTAKDREALTVAHVQKYYSGGYTGCGSAMDQPLGTVTAEDHNAIEVTHVVKFKGEDLGQPPQSPLHTVTASWGEFGTVNSYIRKIESGCDMQRWPLVRDLLNRYCGYHLADDEVVLICINGVECFIADIGLRMLTPRELYDASGFPADYVIERDYLGRKYTKAKQIARCGNAVPPPFAYALTLANVPEMCVRSCQSMAELMQTIAV